MGFMGKLYEDWNGADWEIEADWGKVVDVKMK